MARSVPKSVLEVLAGEPLFSGCSTTELRTIAGLGSHVTVADGTALTTQGAPGREFFLLTRGEARCLVDGTEVAQLGAGDFFGETALVEKQPRNASIVTRGTAEVVVFSVQEFRALLESSPAIADKIQRASRQRAEASAAAVHEGEGPDN